MQANPDDLWARDKTRHPSVPAPNDLDVRLWRYMSGERFRWLVENRRLYMPRLDQLAHSDPLEGTMSDAQAAWWQEQIRSAPTPEAAKKILENYQNLRWFVDRFRQDWCVSCWTMDDSENFAFWRIYGRDERVCETCG